MSDEQQVEGLAAQAADAVRRVLSQAEDRAAEIVRGAESEAATILERAEAEASAIRQRGQSDARGQIEAAKRALDELGGTLAAAASSALPNAETETQETETEKPEEPGESPDPPEEQVSPPADPEPEQAAPAAGNGDDAAERLVAMKMAVDGKDQAAIEAELTEKFGPGDRTELLKEVLGRVAR